jgi:hypothetical protein
VGKVWRSMTPRRENAVGDISMDTVAERQLELRTESGTIAVVASLGMPRKVGSDEWACAWITRFADDVRSREVHGGDSMQALQLAMVTLDSELKLGAEGRGGTLVHFDEPFNSILENSGMQSRTSTAHAKS